MTTSDGLDQATAVFKNAEYHLSHTELELLIRSTNTTRDRALIMMFVETGIRRFEATLLLSQDFSPFDQTVIVRRGKGGRLRILPLSDRLSELLTGICTPNENKPLFRRADGRALSTRQVNRIVATVGRRASLKNPNPRYRNITCHLLRHSFARNWKDAGGNIEALSRILGHASVKTTLDVYGTKSVRDIHQVYNEVIARIHPGSMKELKGGTK